MTAVLFVINAAAYSKDGWKEFRDFFDVRTNVYDYYDLRSYEENPELYEPYGISEEEYNMMRVYNYTVLGDLPKEFFPEYLEACEKLEDAQGIDFTSKSVNAVKVFVKDVLSNHYGTANTVLFAAAVILFIVFIWKKQYSLATYLGIQSAAICAVWLYFTYWGRAIERIQVTMSLIFLAVILHVLTEMKEMQIYRDKETGKLSGNGKVSLSLGMIAMMIIAGMNFTNHRNDNIATTYW